MTCQTAFRRALCRVGAVLLAWQLLASAAAESAVGDFTAYVPLQVAGNSVSFNLNFVMAAFGMIPYGKVIQGQLYFPNTDGCEDFDTSVVPDSSVTPIFVLDGAINNCGPFVRALNAVKVGAVAVIIMAPANAGVATVGVSLNPVNPSYMQDRIRVPVGMVSAADGNNLRQVQNLATPTGTLNFTGAIPSGDQAQVELWFDADDSCGYACDKAQDFLSDMATLALTQDGSGPVVISPHWMLTSGCVNSTDQQSCAQHCVGNGYCYYSLQSDEFSTDAKNDLAVAKETVRRICLWDYLNKRGHTEIFWSYLAEFIDKCKSEDGKYTESCSDSVFGDVSKGKGLLKSDWADCYNLMNGNNVIEQVDANIALAQANSNSDAINRGTRGAVRINNQHFRGAPHANMVIRAACQVVASTAGLCANPDGIPGVCPLSDAASANCMTSASVLARTTMCVVQDDGTPACECEVGWKLKGGECVDVDECKDDDGDVCPYEDTRNVCINSPGGYSCLEYGDKCATPAAGNCWRSADGKLNACKDNLHEFRDAAKSGKTMPADDISECTCAAVAGAGCYKTLTVPGQPATCKQVHCGSSAGQIAGAVVGSFVAAMLTAIGVVWCVRRSHAARHARDEVSSGGNQPNTKRSYAKFEDRPDVEMGPRRTGGEVTTADLKVAIEKVELGPQ